MKRVALFATMILTLAMYASAQDSIADGQLGVPLQSSGESSAPDAPAKSLPLWKYSVKASRGAADTTFTGMMVGTDPIKAKPAVTEVHTYLISVKMQFKDSNHTFDPTELNDCLVDNNKPPKQISVLDAAFNSPIFQLYAYPKLVNDNVMNGIPDGKTQYGDFFQRANFWSNVKGTKYQVLLSPVDKNTDLATVEIGIGTGRSGQYNFQKACSWVGQVDLTWFDLQIRNNLLPALKAVDPTAFPIFLLDSVMVCPSPFTYCIAGYHSSFKDTNGDIQTYAVADFDRSGLLDQPPNSYADVFTLSHEVVEWMDDPIVSEFGNNLTPGNPTPKWGSDTQKVGQIPAGYCEDILEVGDPLSQPPPALKPFTVNLSNFTYHLQEAAYFWWFYGEKASIGTNGAGSMAGAPWFSNHGSLTSDAGPIPVCQNGIWHGQ